MKKTRKILSIVLAVLFAFSSMPVVYTGTAAADAVTYAMDETGTIDNPTLPIKASGTFVQEDSSDYHLNIDQEYLNFVFYQTKADEYFKFSQVLHLEKYCGSLTASINVLVNNFDYDVDQTTRDFFDKYKAETKLIAREGNASDVASFNNWTLDGSYWDCPDYNWEIISVFKGHSATENGEINTGYTRVLNYTTTDNGTATNYQAKITTTAQIVDAREFIAAIENAEAVIANPENYTKAYVSSVEATLNSIPETAKELSAVYTQSDLDGYTALLNDINKNSADYSEYNRLFKNLSSISNAKGAYTEQSFISFKAEIADIDSKLPKNLDATYQSTVNDATQALRVAFSKLVATDVSATDTPANHSAIGASGDARITFNVDNTAFHLMQTKDAQVFQLNQRWTITRNSDTALGEKVPSLIGMTLDTTNPLVSHDNCLSGGTSTLNPNNTSAFINRCVSGIDGSQFSCWNQISGDFNWISNGKLASGVEIEKGKTSVLEVRPVFVGLQKDETVAGGLSLNFLQKFEYEYTIGLIGGTDYTKHFHVNSTVKLTDVRQLIAAHNEAGAILANPEAYNYSEKYLTNLEAVYDSVPREMTAGVEYYDQATVDKLTYALKNVRDDGADYSEFVNLYNQMTAIENTDRYTPESYEVFKDEIEAININLDKTLDASQQNVVDEAVAALKAAYAKLDFYEVAGETVFSTYDIPGYETGALGNSPLYFELGRTEYNFMQTYDNQQFAIKTDLFLQKTNSSYNAEIYSLEYSSPVAGSSTCTNHSSTEHCHNLENITTNNSSDFLGIVANGVEKYAADADAQNWGAVGQNTTWVFDEERSSGNSFISNGKIAAQADISMGTHYASSEIYCNGFGAGDNGDGRNPFTITYVWRLGWSYAQHTVLESTLWAQQVDRHVHIPVTVNLTDARALYKLYEEVTDIVMGDTEETYTLETIVNLYNVYKDIPTDMVYGEEYYTQDQVNAAYDSLLVPYENLKEGADYGDYFAAYVKAQDIIATNNDDGYGNKLYEEEEYNSFVETVTNINNALDKNLDATEENQKTIDDATAGINGAISNLENNKYADYTELEELISQANRILAEEAENPGTYTQSTITALTNAVNAAESISRELPANEENQATIDNAAANLQAAIDGIKYKADYSEYDSAMNEAEEIIAGGNQNGEYPDDVYQEYVDKVTEIDNSLDKDLADLDSNNQLIADATQALEDAKTELNENKKADYDLYYEYLAIAYGEKASNYTGHSYGTFMEKVEAIDAGLDKNLTANDQATVDKAVQDLVDAWLILQAKPETPNVNGDKVFTEADIAGEYSGAFKFSLASTEYKFVQTVNDEKLKVQTDLVVSNADTTNYTINLESLKMSSLDGNELASMDTSGNCFNSDSVTTNDSEALFCEPNITHNVVTGVVMYSADTNGDMAHHTTWQNISGVALSTDGVLNASTTLTEESSASAHYVFASAGGGDTETKTRNYTYVLRLGWSETNNATGETQHYHAHIPVTMNIVDARALFDLYNDVKETVSAGNDGTYTESSFTALENALNNANTDIIFGITDATQEEVNAEYEKLKAASDALSEKADYSGLDEAIEEAEKIVNAPDGTYTEESVKNAQDALDAAENLDKDLPKSEQETVDKVIQDLIDSATNAEEKADYSGLDEAIKEAEKIVNAPDGTYTEESVKKAQDALDAAENLDKDLPKSEQETVDKVIQDLIDSSTNAEEKADYSGLDEAIEEAEKIVNAPEGTYTDETVKNAQDALDAAESLDKDLPKSEQETVDKVIQDLIDSATNAEEKADYTDYNKSKTEADNLVNDDGNGNPIYDEEAFQQYKDKVTEIDNNLDKDLSKTEENQKTVDDASQALKDLRTELDATKGAEQETLDPETTADSLKDKVIEEGGYNPDEVIVEFRNYLGEELAGEAFVGTGSTMRVILKSTGELLEYKLFIVMGDVDGDGDIDNDDYQKSMNVGLKKDTYAEEHSYFFTANDMSGDGYIDVIDCALIRRMF